MPLLCPEKIEWQQETSGRNRKEHSKGPPGKDSPAVHPHHAMETLRALPLTESNAILLLHFDNFGLNMCVTVKCWCVCCTAVTVRS
jgi:hypothetical protein